MSIRRIRRDRTRASRGYPALCARLIPVALCLLMAGALALPAHALITAATWTARLSPPDARAGEMAQVVIEGKIAAPWHVYSIVPAKGLGPKPTEITLGKSGALEPAGKAVEPAPEREFDKGFKTEVAFFQDAVAFGLPVKIAASAAGAQKTTVSVRFQACKNGSCLPPRTVEVPLAFTVAPGSARPDHQAAVTTVPEQPRGYHHPANDGKQAGAPAAVGSTGPRAGGVDDQIRRAQAQGLLAFILLALGNGFIALLTPCVFPMVPITVSYFAKQQEGSGRRSIRGPVAYCLGIIGAFTGLGVLVSALFGATGIQKIATNPVVNLALAVLFIVLALNLFGVYEIALPGWLVDRTQAGAGRGGIVGPLMMGLTFTLTSFTCTVAFVGAVLGGTTQGNFLWPVVGMLAFSTAFASPFFLLALFPQWLARLPKSGTWLVTVKATMGFLELAAALKFLSNADLVWQLGLLTRPVFLAIWFATALVCACYLLGLVRLPHDEAARIGVGRMAVGGVMAVAGILCLAAMNGVTLGNANGFFPPARYPGRATAGVDTAGIQWVDNYDQAKAQANAGKKLLFLNFTGVTCTNCRVMEDTVFTRPDVADELRKFVTVELYTDKDSEQSRAYQKMQLQRFGEVTLPLYVVETPDGRKLAESGFNPNSTAFLGFLREAQSQGGTMAARVE